MTPYTTVPLTPLRRAIAARMTSAKQTIPHYRVAADIVVDALMERRAAINAIAAGGRISLNDCFVRGAGLALVRHPELNIQLVENEIRRFATASIAIIVAVEDGLVTPVIHDADRKPLDEIACESRSLITRARAGALKMSEIVGGSFSISNLGAFGVDDFDAIINPPQCAILALGRARHMILPGAGGAVGTHRVVRATLSLDHRAIDGALGGAFLSTLRTLIEKPDEIFAP